MPALPDPHRRTDLIATLLGLALLLAWDASGLDLATARLFGDAAGFAWREHWLTRDVLHEGGRNAAWVVYAVLIASLWLPVPLLRELPRRSRLWWVLTVLACVLLIPVLKRMSLTSCPWSLAEFGGVAQYVSHWRLGVGDGGEGRCFPSGHASGAFAFLAGWFALRERHQRAALGWLAGVVLAALVFGGAQLVRGAHYPSHTLWTGWICWTLCAASWHLTARWRRAGA